METYIALTTSKACLRLLKKRIEKSIDHLQSVDFEDLESRKEILQKHYDDKEHLEFAIYHLDYLINRLFNSFL